MNDNSRVGIRQDPQPNQEFGCDRCLMVLDQMCHLPHHLARATVLRGRIARTDRED
jgi:hypothetical protein